MVKDLQNTFGELCHPETTKYLYTRIKRVGVKYLPQVRFGLFGIWRTIGNYYYGQQQDGSMKCRASVNSSFKYQTDLLTAIDLIENYKKYRGAGITIW